MQIPHGNRSNSTRSCLRTILRSGLGAGLHGCRLADTGAPGPSAPWESTKAPSLLSKSFRLLDRVKQLLLQLFVALVGREIQAVKAGETAEA